MVNSVFDISGRKAIVTGGTRGLGKQIAEAYCEAGCEVVFIGSNKTRLEQTVAENVAKGYKAYAVVADLTDMDQCDRAYKEALEKLGGVVDIMVPCAGIQYRHSIEEFPFEEFERLQKLNVWHCYKMAQLAIQTMLAQENRTCKGKIILIGSSGCFSAGHNISAYATSKGAILNMAKGMAENVASRGINVNVLCPGYFGTEILNSMDPEKRAHLGDKIPARRIGNDRDLIGPCIFMASDASDYMDGTSLLIDGGLIAIH
ncbi:SDR family NAD(P)-dependent oxidoreductase [uncultured Eubacterium sp.]|uniref:SDR family NAD(P)-dependent oxidoreductase n=1 Tax=uncultured Eubacterium sp. TaxID=165185 RepID=UPI0015A7EFFE|nr:SDR family NAD(P)-dependent oxidoreductase [uncultured Eubacterium sp.]